MNIGDLPDRLRSKIVVDDAGCWLWTAARDTGGYAGAYLNGKKNVGHRLIYELLVGPIPEGLNIDHLCRVRECVNPAHLEPVTQRVNLLRGVGPPAVNASKTHCVHGHEFSPENTLRVLCRKTLVRKCRTCKKAENRTYKARRRQRIKQHS